MVFGKKGCFDFFKSLSPEARLAESQKPKLSSQGLNLQQHITKEDLNPALCGNKTRKDKRKVHFGKWEPGATSPGAIRKGFAKA